MKARLWVLAVAAVLLAAYFLVVERPNWQRDRAQEADERVVLRFDPANIVAVEQYRAGELIRLELAEDGEWWIREPIEYLAKPGSVASFLGRVLEADRYYEMAETLEPEREAGFGLDAENAVLLTLFDRGGFQLHLRVGTATPTGDAYYFQRGGEAAVHLGSEALSTIRLLDYQTLRDPTLFEVESGEIVELEVETPSRSYAMQVDERNLWRLREDAQGLPRGAKLKQWLIRDLLFEISTARVRAYLLDDATDEALAVHGLDADAPRLRWKTAETSGGIVLGNDSDRVAEIFAHRTGERTLLVVASTLLEFVQEPLAELYDPSPIDADFSQLLGIQARWPDGQTLRSAGNGFEQETLVNGAVRDDLSVVTQNVFYGLSRPDIIGGIDIPTDQSLGELLGEPPILLTLFFADREVVVEMGKKPDGASHWFRVQGEPRAHQVDRGVYLRVLGWRQSLAAGN